MTTPRPVSQPAERERLPHIWRTKTSIRDGSPSGRFVVDWVEAETALDALFVRLIAALTPPATEEPSE